MDIIPLIAASVAGTAKNWSNTPTTSGEGILSGCDYLNELLNGGNEKRIYGVLRMKKETFLNLCLTLRRKGLLKDSRNVSIEQQLAQFLWIINYSASYDAVAERFRITKEPVNRYIRH